MFDHVTMRVREVAESKRFYALALGDPSHDDEWFTEWTGFGVAPAAAERPATRGLHVAFGARDRDEVDRWWERMTAAGYASDGAPGERPEYSFSYYGAFVLDPDGNSVELVHHARTDPERSVIDHLWLRAADVAASKRFYLTVAPALDIEIAYDERDRVRFTDGIGSFSFVAGARATENVHLAFGVPGQEAVEEFHRLATAAGHPDNGAPGGRPQYHPGYYGAFVLDPDGNNVEAVFHERASV